MWIMATLFRQGNQKSKELGIRLPCPTKQLTDLTDSVQRYNFDVSVYITSKSTYVILDYQEPSFQFKLAGLFAPYRLHCNG